MTDPESAPAEAGPPTAIALIEQAQRQLDTIRLRCVTLAAFESELDRRSRGESFTIMNELLWTTMIDARDMVLIHFSQWVVSAAEPGGMFKRLRQVPMSSLYVGTKPDRNAWKSRKLWSPNASEAEQADLKRWSAARAHAKRRQLFEDMFPAAATDKRMPQHADLDVLEHLFWEALKPIVHDRNDNRAHPFYGSAPTTATAKMLNFAEIEEHTGWAERFLNQLRVIVDNSSRLSSKPTTQAASVAEDLVDILLFGSRRRMDVLSGLSTDLHSATDRYACQYRDRAYDELWEKRTLADVPFNHPDQLRPPDE